MSKFKLKEGLMKLGVKKRKLGYVYSIEKSYSENIRYYHATTELRPKTIKAVNKIAGVCSASLISRYSISVERGKLFYWVDIEPQIIDIIIGGK